MGVLGNDLRMVEGSSVEQRKNIEIVTNAYRSIRGQVVYASTPITTGKRYYQVLSKYGVNSLELLGKANPSAFYGEILEPNLREGIEMADELSRNTGQTIVSPAVFDAKAQKWNQGEYLFLWSRVIEEKAKEMRMLPGWEYSNGCSAEFVRAIEMQFGFVNPVQGLENVPGSSVDRFNAYRRARAIKLSNFEGRDLRIEFGLSMIANSIIELDSQGFRPIVLMESADKLMAIAQFFRQPELVSRAVAFISQPYKPDFDSMLSDMDRIHKNAGSTLHDYLKQAA